MCAGFDGYDPFTATQTIALPRGPAIDPECHPPCAAACGTILSAPVRWVDRRAIRDRRVGCHPDLLPGEQFLGGYFEGLGRARA